MDTSNVDWVFVAGRPVMRNGVLDADLDRARGLAATAQQRVAAVSPALVETSTEGWDDPSRGPSSAVTSFVVGSRYMPVYLALILLVVVASIWARPPQRRPEPLLPGTFLAITALGQMLVIMTGGIDLSVPGTFLLGGLLMVGVGQQSDERMWIAYLTAIGAAVVIGLLNGILIGGLKLNALIVTLAVGQIVVGIANRYYTTVAIQKPVPPALSEWANGTFLGVTPIFWIGVGLAIVLMVLFRFTGLGRRFQVVGANPVASNVLGLRVNLNQMLAYVVAAVLYATAGVLLAADLRAPQGDRRAPYLLGPIAAVVIGGASLTGAWPVRSPPGLLLLPRGTLTTGPSAASTALFTRVLRPGHHWRHARLGRPDHQSRRKGPA